MFRNVRIYTIDKFGFSHINNYITISGNDLKKKIDFARTQPFYQIDYVDPTGKEQTIKKAPQPQ